MQLVRCYRQALPCMGNFALPETKPRIAYPHFPRGFFLQSTDPASRKPRRFPLSRLPMATKWEGGPPLPTICTRNGDQGCDDIDAEHRAQPPKKDVHAHCGPPFDWNPPLCSQLQLTGFGSLRVAKNISGDLTGL
jgi:hypothetical protein